MLEHPSFRPKVFLPQPPREKGDMQYTHAFIRSFTPELDFLLVLRIVYLVQIIRRRCVGVLKTQNISVSLLDGNRLIRRCHFLFLFLPVFYP